MLDDFVLPVQLDDVVDHLLEDGERLVAADLHQQPVEVVVQRDDLQRLGGGFHGRDVLVEGDQVGRFPAVEDHPERREVERGTRVVDVGHGCPPELEGEPGVPCRGVAVGRVDAGTPACASLDAEQRFAFEHAERFAQGGPGDAEALHELVLRGERVALLELTPHDLTAELRGNQLRGFRHAHRRGDVRGADGVGHRDPCSTGRWLDKAWRHR